MKIAIIANGQFPRSARVRGLITSSDRIVCCDGALQRLEKQGIAPDIVIGDLDSVCRRALRRFRAAYPDRPVIKCEGQDDNDLTKAFDYCIAGFKDIESVLIFSATGRSEAHTIGNVSLLASYESRYDLCRKGIRAGIISDHCTILAARGALTLETGIGRKVSIFTENTSQRFRSEGLQWPLDGVCFNALWKGTLNRACDRRIRLQPVEDSPYIIILD